MTFRFPTLTAQRIEVATISAPGATVMSATTSLEAETASSTSTCRAQVRGFVCASHLHEIMVEKTYPALYRVARAWIEAGDRAGVGCAGWFGTSGASSEGST